MNDDKFLKWFEEYKKTAKDDMFIENLKDDYVEYLNQQAKEVKIDLPTKPTKEDFAKFIGDQFNFAISVIPDDKKQYWIKRIIESKSLTAKLELTTSIILHYMPR